MHRPRPVPLERVLHSRVEHSVIIPHCHIALFHRRHAYVLRFENSELDICQEGSDFVDFVDDSGLRVRAATDVQAPGADAVDLEGFFARCGIYPSERVLKEGQFCSGEDEVRRCGWVGRPYFLDFRLVVVA